MGEKKYRDKKWMEKQYLEKDKTKTEIAKELDVTYPTISGWLKKYNISKSKEYECRNCGKKFDSYSARNCHESVHGGHKFKVKCDFCGKEFEINEYRLKNDDKHFHSIECKSKWQSNNSTLAEKNLPEPKSGKDNPNWKGGKVTKYCEYCGDDFKVWLARKDEAKYCSPECRSKWRSENWNGKNHPTYGHSFEGLKGQEHPMYGRKGEEHPKWNSKKMKCEYCGDDISVTKSELEKFDHHFCSPECYHKWTVEEGVLRKDGDNLRLYYGPSWSQQKKRMLDRDNHTCQLCGKTKKDMGRELDVHHIKPIKEFRNDNGEINYEEANKLENLIALCRSCHNKVEGWGVKPQIVN